MLIIPDIYRDKLLKYPLTDKEYKLIPNVWNFLDLFKKKFVFISDYRNHLIDEVRRKYTAEQFQEYESILNKMFWNLRWLLFPLWMDRKMNKERYIDFIRSDYNDNEELPYFLLLCDHENYDNNEDLKDKIRNNILYRGTGSYYRSFINKLIMVDKNNKKIITKSMEGTPHIFSNNYFNELTSHILLDKDLYQKIMHNPFLIKNNKINVAEFYYEYDYPFPNLNFGVYKFNKKNDRLNRIYKMYYNDPQKTKYWFKLIR